jgi:hypothetical protein
LESGAAKGLRFALLQPAKIKAEVDGFFRILMGDIFKELANGDLDAEFFAQLPNQTGLERLSWLQFAPGKFPKSAQMSVRIALGDQQLAAMENQGGGDSEGRGWGGRWGHGERMWCVLRVA